MHCKYPLITLLTSLSLWSCQKDSLQPYEPPPVTPPKLDVLWQKPLTPDTGRYTGDAQFINNGGIVYSINFISPSGTVNKRNGNTGELIWSFGAFDRPASFNPSEQVFNVLGNTLVNVQDFTYFLDISGNLVWKKDVREKNGSSFYFSQLIGDYLYTIHYEGNNPAIKSSSIVRTHYLSGEWDTLVTIPQVDNRFGQFIRAPTLWVNPQGDSVLILRINELSNVLGLRNRFNIRAWNMRTKQFEWELKDFIPEGNPGVYQPVVSDNRLYINGPNAVYCINLETGSMLWEKPFKFIQSSSIIEHKNSIIFCGDSEGMWSLNKTDGSQNWYNADVIGAAYQLFYFDGVVYQTSSGSGRLYAVDAETGATIWKERSPNRQYAKTDDASFSYQGVAFDPINRVLFTCDHYYIMCIRLPE